MTKKYELNYDWFIKEHDNFIGDKGDFFREYLMYILNEKNNIIQFVFRNDDNAIFSFLNFINNNYHFFDNIRNNRKEKILREFSKAYLQKCYQGNGDVINYINVFNGFDKNLKLIGLNESKLILELIMDLREIYKDKFNSDEINKSLVNLFFKINKNEDLFFEFFLLNKVHAVNVNLFIDESFNPKSAYSFYHFYLENKDLINEKFNELNDETKNKYLLKFFEKIYSMGGQIDTTFIIKYFDSLSETFNIKDTDNHLTGFDNTFYYNMDFDYNVKNISFLDTMLLKHIFNFLIGRDENKFTENLIVLFERANHGNRNKNDYNFKILNCFKNFYTDYNDYCENLIKNNEREYGIQKAFEAKNNVIIYFLKELLNHTNYDFLKENQLIIKEILAYNRDFFEFFDNEINKMLENFNKDSLNNKNQENINDKIKSINLYRNLIIFKDESDKKNQKIKL